MTTDNFTIVIDDRENKPYQFDSVADSRITTQRLNVGDYTIEGLEDSYAVERKTLDDLATSCGSDRERFENEIQRAQSLDDFVVVIESQKRSLYDYEDCQECPNYYANLHPNSLIGTLNGWPKKYNTLEFRFAGSRMGGKAETLYQLDQWFVNEIV